jgi:hypothetical protein
MGIKCDIMLFRGQNGLSLDAFLCCLKVISGKYYGFFCATALTAMGLAVKYVVYQAKNRFLLCTLGYKLRTRPDTKSLKGGRGCEGRGNTVVW